MGGIRFAFFNWRDKENPACGGSEIFVQNVMRCIVEEGNEADLFTSSFKGSPPETEMRGSRIIRYAGKYLIYPKSILCYNKRIRGKYDIIIESVNGVPFFTPLFAREPVIPLIHQLTRGNWYSGLPLPIAFAGYHSEDAMLRLYKDHTAIAPSQSTRDDLLALGFKDVRIVYNAPDMDFTPPPADKAKENVPTLVYLGRIVRSKRIDHCIMALAIIRKKIPEAVLWIIGSGDDMGRLKSIAKRFGLADSVIFHDYVSEAAKADLLSRAHIMLFPGMREGWGISVIESNLCGTPVIGYDIPGLRDSIKDGGNGILVKDGDFGAMAQAAMDLLASDDGSKLALLSARSALSASRFSWKRSAKDILKISEEVISCRKK